MSDRSMDLVLAQLDALLIQVILLQQDQVSKVCARCEDVCCSKVQFLFDEKDRIYQKLSGREAVPSRGGKNTKGCRYLTPQGCRLEPKARPFTCHRYICPSLGAAMTETNPELPDLLEQTFTAMDRLRSRLWKLYLEARDPLLFRLQLRQ